MTATTHPPVPGAPTDWPRPGPGTWVLDLDHTGPTPSRQVRDLFPEAARQGFAEGFALLGAPLATIDTAFVNGRFYRRTVPVVGADRDAGQPPAPVLWMATRLSPTFRRLERTARAALAGRIWRQELDRWTSTWRPSIVAVNQRLGAVDPSELDDVGLAARLGALWDHLRMTTALHFRLHATDAGPIGLLLASTDTWGLDRADVLGALAGASPATNDPATALGAVRRLVATARSDDDPPRTLDDVRALSAEVAEAVDRYVDTYGWRLTTGYDLTDRTLVELSDLLVRTLTAPPDAPIPSGATQGRVLASGQASVAALRAQAPEHQRREFDALVDDARACYGLRDENGPITYEWPAGLLRRALLETARRLVAAGALGAPEHVFDASVDELRGLLTDDRGPTAGVPAAGLPTAGELHRRHDERLRWASLEPPATLGPPEQEPPLKVLPPSMRRLMGATTAIFELLDGAEAGGAPPLTGVGVGDRSYRGTARVVHDAATAFDVVEPGDVLVTTRTVPTFNTVLTIAGAVVVEAGGLMSHAAVMARELGLAGVIGAAGACTTIPDGATVEVDPVAGRVTVLTPPAGRP